MAHGARPRRWPLPALWAAASTVNDSTSTVQASPSGRGLPRHADGPAFRRRDLDCPACGRRRRFAPGPQRRASVCRGCGHALYPAVGTPLAAFRTPLSDWFFGIALPGPTPSPANSSGRRVFPPPSPSACARACRVQAARRTRQALRRLARRHRRGRARKGRASAARRRPAAAALRSDGAPFRTCRADGDDALAARVPPRRSRPALAAASAPHRRRRVLQNQAATRRHRLRADPFRDPAAPTLTLASVEEDLAAAKAAVEAVTKAPEPPPRPSPRRSRGPRSRPSRAPAIPTRSSPSGRSRCAATSSRRSCGRAASSAPIRPS